MECSKCGVDKPEGEFRKGHRQCKTCEREYDRQYRAENPEKVKAKNRRYYVENKDALNEKHRQWLADNKEAARKQQARRYLEVRDKRTEYARQYYARTKDERLAYNRRVKAEHPEKIKARSAVANAITSGRLKRASECKCKRCDGQATEYHHHSYDEESWLDVVAVCRSCHRDLHFGRKAA